LTIDVEGDSAAVRAMDELNAPTGEEFAESESEMAVIKEGPPGLGQEGDPTTTGAVFAVQEANAGSPSLGAIVALHREVSPRNSPQAVAAAIAAAWQVQNRTANGGRSSPASVADEAVVSTLVQHCVHELVKSVEQLSQEATQTPGTMDRWGH